MATDKKKNAQGIITEGDKPHHRLHVQLRRTQAHDALLDWFNIQYRYIRLLIEGGPSEALERYSRNAYEREEYLIALIACGLDHIPQEQREFREQ